MSFSRDDKLNSLFKTRCKTWTMSQNSFVKHCDELTNQQTSYLLLVLQLLLILFSFGLTLSAYCLHMG